VFERLLERRKRVLRQLDDLSPAALLEQLFECIDRLLDALYVAPYLAVGNEPAVGERLVYEGPQRLDASRRALPRLRRHQQQAPRQPFILVRVLDQQLDEGA
jgi:hypothetical protein